MRKPKMILFDYGQTLIDEGVLDGVKGTAAVLKYAVENRYGRTAEEIQAEADRINLEMGRGHPENWHLRETEIPNHMFTRYLYESQGIELSIKAEEIDRVFWAAASPPSPTDGVIDFLRFLREQGIRTGVISNLSFSGKVLAERIRRCLPEHTFEFIIASSEYLYRKPHPKIFALALQKAGLPPEDLWFVGDNLTADVEGPRTAGMLPVWYLGASRHIPEPPEQKVLTVTHWRELQKILEQAE